MQRVLICEAHAGLRGELARAVRGAGYAAEPAAGGAEALARAAGLVFDAALVAVAGAEDLALLERLAALPRAPALLATGSDPSVELAVGAMKRGARDFLRRPVALRAVEAALRAALAPAERRDDELAVPVLATGDPGMQRLLERAEAAAATEATVLITGESGTGKDLLARLIHRRGARRAGPFVTVNCAALPEALAESELFGHERGAFTGAFESRAGQIAAANGGTLLLDEVNETPPALQPKLLRVLQEREVLPVGGVVPRAVDVRILATTQRDLRGEVRAGRFREDLYYRLDVIVLRIPPLRERPADVPLLARTLLARYAAAHGSDPPRLGERALRELSRHEFRGNVRELANLMKRAVVLAPGREVELERLLERRAAPGPAARGPLEGTLNLRELERRAILRSLAESAGNRTEASRTLGISVRTLRNKIRAYGLA